MEAVRFTILFLLRQLYKMVVSANIVIKLLKKGKNGWELS